LLKFSKKKSTNEANSARIAELLLTRFTHDMAGPISAVANGIDFILDSKITDDGGAVEIRNQAIDLVDDSSKQSLARLQAYRVAYGIVYKKDTPTETDELKDIVKRFFQKSQVEVRWNSSTPKTITAEARKLCISMILTISRVMIYGGKISISFLNGGQTISVKSQSSKFKVPDQIQGILLNKSNIQPDVENVPYFLIRELCEDSNIKIDFEYSDEEVKTVKFETAFP